MEGEVVLGKPRVRSPPSCNSARVAHRQQQCAQPQGCAQPHGCPLFQQMLLLFSRRGLCCFPRRGLASLPVCCPSTPARADYRPQCAGCASPAARAAAAVSAATAVPAASEDVSTGGLCCFPRRGIAFLLVFAMSPARAGDATWPPRGLCIFSSRARATAAAASRGGATHTVGE